MRDYKTLNVSTGEFLAADFSRHRRQKRLLRIVETTLSRDREILQIKRTGTPETLEKKRQERLRLAYKNDTLPLNLNVTFHNDEVSVEISFKNS